MSLKIIKNLTILIVIGEAFKSITLSLNFILKYPPTIIIYTAAIKLLSLYRTSSRVFLNTIYNLSKATAFSIYIKAYNTPPKL